MIPLKDNVPTRSFPIVTVALIVANVAVWVFYQLPNLEQSVNELAYHPCEVEDSCATIGEDWPVTVFSSMFMHAGWLHIGGNMLFLWIFGNNVEDAMGRVRFLLFYLASGVAATALQTFVTLRTAGDEAATIPNLGASGAVSGVLGAYFLLLPNARILTAIFFVVIFFLREIPAILFLGVYFLLQFWQANFQLQHPPEGGGVAVFAHLGGIIFGVIAVHLFATRRPMRPHY